MSEKIGMTYAGVGVDYDTMDPFKRACQLAGLGTADNIARFASGEFHEFEPSRGESAYLIEAAKSYVAFVIEGLGTKNLVADAMYELNGGRDSYYDHIAQDTVAMIVNDMITMGALPISVAMHLAVGNSDWFKDEQRSSDLINGWKTACDLSRCTWGCGETPTLRDVIIPGTIELSGAAVGFVKPKDRLVQPQNITAGDAIVIIGSSGIHANGLTMAREIAKGLDSGFLTKLSDGRNYGDALLDPTHIYVGLVEDCLDRGVNIHYLVNITGHGWRKLMRAPQPFHYVVTAVPEPQPVFHFIKEKGRVQTGEMYGNFNMGAGFAVYVSPDDVATVLDAATENGLTALNAGTIVEAEDKQVIIDPVGLQYNGETLAVR